MSTVPIHTGHCAGHLQLALWPGLLPLSGGPSLEGALHSLTHRPRRRLRRTAQSEGRGLILGSVTSYNTPSQNLSMNWLDRAIPVFIRKPHISLAVSQHDKRQQTGNNSLSLWVNTELPNLLSQRRGTVSPAPPSPLEPF